MSFSSDVSKWTTKARVETDQQLRKVVFEMFSRIVQRTPVDTGRARGAWAVTMAPAPAWTDTGALDPSAAASGVLTALNNVKAGGIVWIASGLPYIQRLEYGYSKQAPSGMVRITAVEFGDIVAAA